MDTRLHDTQNGPMRRFGLSLCATFVLLGAGAACSGGDPESSASPSVPAESEPAETPTGTATATSPPAEESACANEATVVEDPSFAVSGRLKGDVNDDGVADEVSLAVDESGEPGCQSFIVMTSEELTHATEIAVPEIPFELGFPRLIALPEIDGRPGAEVVVGVTAGASTQFAAVYTWVDDRLVQIEREGAESPEENLLAFGGSVGQQFAFDCAPEVGDGVVVVSEARPVGNGARFSYVRRFFVSNEPGVVAEDESLRDEGTVRFNRFDTLHEFPNSPFGSCPTGEVAG